MGEVRLQATFADYTWGDLPKQDAQRPPGEEPAPFEGSQPHGERSNKDNVGVEDAWDPR